MLLHYIKEEKEEKEEKKMTTTTTQMATSNLTRVCMQVPPNIESYGIWDGGKDPLLGHPLPILLLQFFVIFAVSEATHFIFKNLGIPKFISQMTAALIMSPALLGRLSGFKNFVFPLHGRKNLDNIGLFAYVVFLFLSGVKIDLKIIGNVGRVAAYIGVFAAVVPMVLCIIALNLTTGKLKLTPKETDSMFMLAATHASTNFPIVSILLFELKIMSTELGRLSLSSATAANIFTFLFRFGSITKERAREKGAEFAVKNVSCILAFVAAVMYVFRPAMFWIIKQTPEGKPVKSVYIVFIFIAALASGLFTDMLGHFVFLGPLLLGFAVPDGPPLGSAVEEKVESFLSNILLPVFVTSVFWSRQAYTASFTISLANWNSIVVNFILAVITFISKVAICILPAWLCNLPVLDGVLVGLVISCKGIVEVGTYAMFRDDQLITEEMFLVAVICTIISAMVAAFLLNCLYDPGKKYLSYSKRNIMNIKQDAELRIITCIYRPFDIPAIINFLNISNPTQSNQISIFVLHLVELVGRVTPMFISHKLQKRSDKKSSYSENIISAFRDYERNNTETAKLNIFTVVSPTQIMDEDIRNLALNKQASFLVLPFHKQWALNGSIELEDNKTVRTINCSIVDKAPCSVGILIQHGNAGMQAKGSYRVCLIFIGGHDDREALALLKRMVNSSKVKATVVHLISPPQQQAHNKLDWDRMLDAEEVKCVRQMCINGRGEIEYVEKEAADGSVTASIVHSLVNDCYDLMIVGGRREATCPQVSGLEEMCEFEELGPLGDLLASKDLNGNTAVLVMQQHRSVSKLS